MSTNKKKLTGQQKVAAVMREHEKGTLMSSSGKVVPKNRKDIALAIAMSKAGLNKKKKK